MKILVHKHKYGDQYYDISTPTKEEEGFRMLFRELDDFDCYTRAEKREAARDFVLLKTILLKHRDREYECWIIVGTMN